MSMYVIAVILLLKKVAESKSSIIVITHNAVSIFDFGTTVKSQRHRHTKEAISIISFLCEYERCVLMLLPLLLLLNVPIATPSIPYLMSDFVVLFVVEVGIGNLFADKIITNLITIVGLESSHSIAIYIPANDSFYWGFM